MSINKDREAGASEQTGEYYQAAADYESYDQQEQKNEKQQTEGDQENLVSDDQEHPEDDDQGRLDDDDQERSDFDDQGRLDDDDQERSDFDDQERLEGDVHEKADEDDLENSNESVMKHTEEENMKQLKVDVIIPEEKAQNKTASDNQRSSETEKSNSQSSQRPSQQKLAPMRSYLLMKRSSKQQQQQLSPNRVQLEANQLLPRLRQSQPGIGYYGRVRGRAPGRAVDLWSSHEPVGQPLLVLGPSPDLTGHFYTSSSDKNGAAAITAASVHGHYPFSRIVYPNLSESQRAAQTIRAVQHQPMQRSLTHSGGEGTFVLRHKLRQSAGCLARILDSSSTGEAAVKRAISRAK